MCVLVCVYVCVFVCVYVYVSYCGLNYAPLTNLYIEALTSNVTIFGDGPSGSSYG
jgi:hypothetical protein